MSELLPISLVAEYVYCPRSAWLFHNEGTFKANEFTVDGELVHRRVHTAGTQQREGRKQFRAASDEQDEKQILRLGQRRLLPEPGIFVGWD